MTMRQEQGLFTHVIRILGEFLQRVIDAVLGAHKRFGISPDPAGVYEVAPWWNSQIDNLVADDLEQIAEEGWQEVVARLGLDVPFISTDTFIQAQLAVTQNLLVRIPDEVYNLIFAELNDGINDGDDPDQLAARIEAVLSMTHSERWPERARTIAVTEANRANNAGAYAAGLQSESIEGIGLRKRWLATNDRRTRHDHRAADGQQQSLRQPFMVGGWPLQFPGDPTGPPEQVIWCRCALVVTD
jgi:uncharacterized protein with gpF-like domain